MSDQDRVGVVYRTTPDKTLTNELGVVKTDPANAQAALSANTSVAAGRIIGVCNSGNGNQVVKANDQIIIKPIITRRKPAHAIGFRIYNVPPSQLVIIHPRSIKPEPSLNSFLCCSLPLYL